MTFPRLAFWFRSVDDRSGPTCPTGRRTLRAESPAPHVDPPARSAQDAANESLVVRLVAGEQDALREIILSHTRQLGAVATAMTGSAALAEEVLQDVFLMLWERRESLSGVTNLTGYLYRLTRNRAIDVQRHERSQWELGTRALAEIDDASAIQGMNAGEAALATEDLRAFVLGALEIVPPRCREIFLLQWEASLTAPEIAARLGVGVPTVYNQLSKAIRALTVAFSQRAE